MSKDIFEPVFSHDEAPQSFLDCLDKKLLEMGVADAYSDSDLKDAMYLAMQDVLKELEEHKRDGENSEYRDDVELGISIGLQIALDGIKKHFGIS